MGGMSYGMPPPNTGGGMDMGGFGGQGQGVMGIPPPPGPGGQQDVFRGGMPGAGPQQ